MFPTQYTESVRKGSKETFTKPSMTEPDNAMSIPEIIARFTRGQGLGVEARPWIAGSAPDSDGSPVNDAEFEQFMETIPKAEPATPSPVPAEPVPAEPVPAPAADPAAPAAPAASAGA